MRHVDPHRRRGRVYRAYTRVVASPPGAWFSRRIMWRLDPHIMRLTRSRLGLGVGVPTALLETRGARSGRQRRNAVIYFHDGDRVIVIASKLGLPEHPSWLYNVRAHPDVMLDGERFRAAEITESAERERLWALADNVFPPFATYRRRAAPREISILALTGSREP